MDREPATLCSYSFIELDRVYRHRRGPWPLTFRGQHFSVVPELILEQSQILWQYNVSDSHDLLLSAYGLRAQIAGGFTSATPRFWAMSLCQLSRAKYSATPKVSVQSNTRVGTP